MILLNSNAEHIFWLGRYLARTQYLCSIFPFQDVDMALNYAHAFCLPAFDVDSMNELVLNAEQPASFYSQFKYAQSNIQDLRGVLSAKSYAELSRLIRNASDNPGYICDVVTDCQDVLESESEDVFLFFSLGQAIEQLDRQLRMQQDIQHTIAKIEHIVIALVQFGWESVQEAWQALKQQPNSQNFYHFSDHIQNMFEVAV
ncbi:MULTISPECIES: hypothetical protein [Acinetobacter]|uniref:hypothetical protein n=1 Tax=Acinetobacter TaxID=469 RepID=UPI0015D337E7|nr:MULTISPECIES: hypothetical protein [Acinetobacter]MCL6231520.1 hypothetical protein [Acinetobacter amyesii]UUS66322.1 hypothetical protein MST18_06340 [Acinetobacter sp. YH12068_T]